MSKRKFLLDTQILLWWLAGDERLGPKLNDLIADPESLIFVSSASIWEVRIKESLGKLTIPPLFFEVLQQEPFERLEISWEHADLIHELPKIHKDPFDRILIAQAIKEGLTLLSADPIVKEYPVSLVAP